MDEKLDGNIPSEKGLELLGFLMKNIKGQDSAIKDLVDAIEVYESGLFLSAKPIYTGLLCGSSGVGKTLTAEMLAKFWFGSPAAFTKIPCEAYSADHSIAALIGSPAGYIGHWDPNNQHSAGTPPILWQGNIDRFALERDPKLKKLAKERCEYAEEMISLQINLLEKILIILDLFDEKGVVIYNKIDELRKQVLEARSMVSCLRGFDKKIRCNDVATTFSIPERPKSIILFDEIEKASPTLHNILLNIIDKAQLQLANGMATDFSNSVILMTTNVGSRAIADVLNPKKFIGFLDKKTENSSEDINKQIYQKSLEGLKEFFPPEFLARLDRISVYRPLSREILKDIVDLELRRFQEQILEVVPICLNFSEEVREFILAESTDKPENGARLVKNKVLKYLRKPLCRLKNRGLIKEADIIYVTLEVANGKKSVAFYKDCKKKSL